MKIFVGLGNPGKEYRQTRHNVGFMAVEQWAATSNFTHNAKFFAELVKTNFGQNEAIFFKPQTYMNDSGKAVRALLDFYKIAADKTAQNEISYPELVVVHDDLDIVFGEYKIQFGKGPKVHHGLQSIYQNLGTSNFWHIRVGIDGRGGNRAIPGKNYVLSKFSTEELSQLEQTLAQIKQKLLLF